MTRMMFAASSASGSWQYLLANTKQASASWTCRTEQKSFLILGAPLRKLERSSLVQLSKVLQNFLAKGYILSLSDSFHYNFMRRLLKGFLNSIWLCQKRKFLFNLYFWWTLLFHVLTKLASKRLGHHAENYGQKVLQKPFLFFSLFMCTMCNKFFFFKHKMKGKHASIYKD